MRFVESSKIAATYGLEASDGTTALVMETVLLAATKQLALVAALCQRVNDSLNEPTAAHCVGAGATRTTSRRSICPCSGVSEIAVMTCWRSGLPSSALSI